MQLNSELRAQARERLEGKWGTFVLMTFLMLVIQTILQIPGYIGSLLEILSPENVLASLSFSNISNILSLLALPLSWGLTVSLLRNHREESVDLENLFDGFRGGRYTRVFCALFPRKPLHVPLGFAAHHSGHHEGIFLCPYTLHSFGRAGTYRQASHHPQLRNHARPPLETLLPLPELYRLGHSQPPHLRYRFPVARALHECLYCRFLRRCSRRI